MADYTNDGRLKPCPLCGGHAHITEVVRSFVPSAYFAACDDQDCRLFETPGMKHYHETVDGAVDAWNAMGRCSDCTERQGYYLDAETIRNQQEHIAELQAENARLYRINENIGAELANFGEHRDKAIAERDELIRDFEQACGGLCVDCDQRNPYYPDESDEICLLAIRAKAIGVEL